MHHGLSQGECSGQAIVRKGYEFYQYKAELNPSHQVITDALKASYRFTFDFAYHNDSCSEQQHLQIMKDVANATHFFYGVGPVSYVLSEAQLSASLNRLVFHSSVGSDSVYARVSECADANMALTC